MSALEMPPSPSLNAESTALPVLTLSLPRSLNAQTDIPPPRRVAAIAINPMKMKVRSRPEFGAFGGSMKLGRFHQRHLAGPFLEEPEAPKGDNPQGGRAGQKKKSRTQDQFEH